MKFKLGDKARVVYIRSGVDAHWKAGVTVTIIDLYRQKVPKEDFRADYVVLLESGESADCLEDQLEPIVKEKGSWKIIERMVGWNPTKVTIDE